MVASFETHTIEIRLRANGGVKESCKPNKTPFLQPSQHIMPLSQQDSAKGAGDQVEKPNLYIFWKGQCLYSSM